MITIYAANTVHSCRTLGQTKFEEILSRPKSVQGNVCIFSGDIVDVEQMNSVIIFGLLGIGVVNILWVED